MNLENVKFNLKKMREEQKLTPEQLSKLSGISSMTIRNIENSKYLPNPKTVFKLSVALNCDFDDLVSD